MDLMPTTKSERKPLLCVERRKRKRAMRQRGYSSIGMRKEVYPVVRLSALAIGSDVVCMEGKINSKFQSSSYGFAISVRFKAHMWGDLCCVAMGDTCHFVRSSKR